MASETVLFPPYVTGDNTLENRIVACLQQKAASEALLLAERLPQHSPGRLFLEGWALFQRGHTQEAAKRFHALPNTSFHPLSHLQNELHDLSEEREFLRLLEALGDTTPQLAELRAASRTMLGEFEEGEKELRARLKNTPSHPALMTALATLLVERGTFEEALSLLQDVTGLLPDHWAGYSNLGCVLTQIGRAEEAMGAFHRAIALAPHEPRTRLNHSLALLKAGRFAQGWHEHEWRLKLPGHTTLPQEKLLPTLEAHTSLTGKTILVTQEEGLGDTLMYLRYLPALAVRGARLHVWCGPELASLIRNLPCVDEVQTDGILPAYDYHCPFISLPRTLNALPGAGPEAPVPYLSPSPARHHYWEQHFKEPAPTILRVGLVWAGGHHKHDRTARLLDRHRSLSLQDLAPLASLPNTQFFSLQKGGKAAEKELFPAPLTDLMAMCQDMEDTAALITHLDVVVSVDTSVLHLAGALGKPVILLDRFCNCWRWGQDQEQSPWYPTLRIVRQKQFGDWKPVIETVRTLLSHMSPA